MQIAAGLFQEDDLIDAGLFELSDMLCQIFGCADARTWVRARLTEAIKSSVLEPCCAIYSSHKLVRLGNVSWATRAFMA